MLHQETTNKILAFVKEQPRSVHEIALMLGRNWRTADRYVKRISEETGSISTKTFRGGTRGALKVVYFVSTEQLATGATKERLLNQILRGRKKTDFSPFDIYQFAERRSVIVEKLEDDKAVLKQDFVSLFRGAQKKLLLFSGNISMLRLTQDGVKIIDALEEAARRGVEIRIVCRIDVATLKNLELVQDLNNRLGHDAIEIRHAEQPLRCTLVDGARARFKESQNPAWYKPGELETPIFLFYDIFDKDWCTWLEKVFWKMFAAGIPAQQRLESLKEIENKL